MPRKFESFDYEGVTPPRSRRGGGTADEWEPLHRRPNANEEVPVSAVNSIEAPPVANKTDALPSMKERILRRGHSLGFVGLLLFTAFVYFRPYELFPGLSAISSGAKWIAIATLIVFLPTQLGLEGNLTTRTREVNLLLALALAALISVPMAISPAEGWDTFSEFFKVVTMFIVLVNVVRTESRLRLMLLLALSASLVMSVAAFLDYRAGRFLIGGVRIKGIIGGLFDNPNDLALHLVTMVPIGVGLALSSRGILKKLVYLIVALLMTIAIVVTFSRGGFLGLMAVGLVVAWKLGRKNRALVVVLFLLVLLTFMVLAPAEYGSRLASIWGSDATGSSNARQQLFWRSLIVALRYPLFGVGIGNFHFRSLQEQVSHNAYTQVAAEIGIAAAVFYTLFMIVPLKKLKRIERETKDVKTLARFHYLAMGLQASLIGYMVSSFFASVAYLWYVYYLVGYSVCLDRIYASVAAEGQMENAKGDRVKVGQVWSGQELPAAEPLRTTAGQFAKAQINVD